MKNKFYWFMIISIVLISYGFFNINKPQKEEIKINKEYGKIDPINWYGMISTGVNYKGLKVEVDGILMNNYYGYAIMDDNLSINIPYKSCKELFDCSIFLSNKKKLVIRKGQREVVAEVGKNEFELDGEKMTLENKLYYDEKKMLFIPLELFEKAYEYESKWESSLNKIKLTCKNKDKFNLPEKYRLDEDKRIFNSARDQSLSGTCWVYAGLGALESSLTPEGKYDFSEKHASTNNVYERDSDEGGQYSILWSYLASWKGPVLEKNGASSKSKVAKHVQEMQIIEEKNYKDIKKAIYKYGGVQSSLYISLDYLNTSTEYYNSEKSAYLYDGSEKSNHDIYIIGWDDNYPKENFNGKAKEDGAFICRNSWGERFGENGNFYVSYEDTNIGTYNEIYTKVDSNKNFDNIYEYDESGWCGTLGFTHSERAYACNVYTAEKDEVLKAMSFYATVPNTKYEAFVCEDFRGTAQLSDNMELVSRGTFKRSGYYTVKIDDIDIAAGKKFALVIMITAPNSTKPIAVECKNELVDKVVKLRAGEGYYSLDGKKWESAEDSECNICLKAFTDDKEKEDE